MLAGRIVVLDVGKTLTKLTLWDQDGRCLDQSERYNPRIESAQRCWLDTDGIERWAQDVLRQFARTGAISAIIPVGHGAAAAIVRDGRLACPVPDYEDPIEPAVRAEYDAQRDPFSSTGSPALPVGLNLGAQLHRLERERPDVLSGDALILTWPQYWAWRFCGVAASEVSSLGCHTDLWNRIEGGPSALARRRGWAARLAPLRRAEEVLGYLDPDWAARTGLSPQTRIYCGMHDSNAALLAARGFDEIRGREATLLSTGTWFIAMRMPAEGVVLDLAALPALRDCLVNLDVRGRPVPSARFMGGRELELMGRLDVVNSDAVIQTLPEVIETGAMALPGWVPGVGPYPNSRARWLREPADCLARTTAMLLYAALMVDTTLDLIGAGERVMVEGRFAMSDAFLNMLATLRPDVEVLVDASRKGCVAMGALRLVEPGLITPGALQRILPVAADLSQYKERWRRAVEAELRAA